MLDLQVLDATFQPLDVPNEVCCDGGCECEDECTDEDCCSDCCEPQ